MEERCGEEGISPALTIIMILATVIAAIFTALYVFLYKSSTYTLPVIAVILIGAGGAILVFEIRRQNRKLERMDKGRKILEIKQRGIEAVPKSLRIAAILLCFILVFGIIVNAITGNEVYLPLISVLIADLVIFMSERKYEIYERGMRYGMVFVKWDEIRDVEWKNGILEIKTEKTFGSLRIRDKDGRVRDVVERLRGDREGKV